MMSREARRARAFEAAFDARDPFQTLILVWADAAATTSRTTTQRALARFTREYERFRRRALRVDLRRVMREIYEEDE